MQAAFEKVDEFLELIQGIAPEDFPQVMPDDQFLALLVKFQGDQLERILTSAVKVISKNLCEMLFAKEKKLFSRVRSYFLTECDLYLTLELPSEVFLFLQKSKEDLSAQPSNIPTPAPAAAVTAPSNDELEPIAYTPAAASGTKAAHGIPRTFAIEDEIDPYFFSFGAAVKREPALADEGSTIEPEDDYQRIPSPVPSSSSSFSTKPPFIPAPFPMRTEASSNLFQLDDHIPTHIFAPVLKRLQNYTWQYQLVDMDLNVGINILHRKAAAKGQKIHFLIPGSLDQNHNGNSISILKELTQLNKGSLCAAIMNIHGSHWINIFAFTNSDNQTQILFIDPFFEEESKLKTTEDIQTALVIEFENAIISNVSELSQQFNDHECGIVCLRNIDDVIDKGLITIENGQLVFHRERLTLDANRYKGHEQDFVMVYEGVRIHWEGLLSKETSSNYVFSGGTEERLPYDFMANKKVQMLKSEGMHLLSQIETDFRSQPVSLVKLMASDNNSPVPSLDDERYKEWINDYLAKNELCVKFRALAAELENVNRQLSETNFNMAKLAARLLGVCKQEFKQVKLTFVSNAFCQWLEREKLLVSLNNFENNFAEFSQAFPHHVAWAQHFPDFNLINNVKARVQQRIEQSVNFYSPSPVVPLRSTAFNPVFEDKENLPAAMVENASPIPRDSASSIRREARMQLNTGTAATREELELAGAFELIDLSESTAASSDAPVPHQPRTA